MEKVTSEGVGVFAHHYPKLTVVVTAHGKGKDNAMAAAWHSSISLNPPLYGVSIAPRRFTYQQIVESKEFGINFLPLEKAELITALGATSGRDIDKFHEFNVATEKPIKTSVPILRDAYAAYECRLIDDRTYGDHQWLVGEVVAVHWQKEVFTNDIPDLEKVMPAIYLGREIYVAADKSTARKFDRAAYIKRPKT